MSDFTDKMSLIGKGVKTYLNLDSSKTEIGVKKVWYGDHDLIPETPAIVISPQRKERTLKGTGHLTLNEFRIFITLHHSRMEDQQLTREDCDDMAEKLEDLLHANKRLDGLLISSFVQTMEFGVASNGRSLMKATRLLWIGQNQTRI